MAQKIIFHVDVNSAFLSWEAVRRLAEDPGCVDLRTIPAAIGGDRTKRQGVVLAKSIPAKKYGIHTGEPIVDALRKCPELYLAPPDHRLYYRNSEALLAILSEYTPDVDQTSIDEAFLDMTGTKGLWGDPVAAAERLREQVYKELGFTVNVGISVNRLLAKMASDFRKPNLVHTLFPEEIESKMWPLPVSGLFFVGHVTAEKLRLLGIRTIGELAKSDPSMLRSHFKKHGQVIWEFANGIDTALEAEKEPVKGIGNSTTTSFDVEDADTAKIVLMSLAETVGVRLRKEGVKAESLSVTIRSREFKTSSHQMALGNATDITAELYHAACCLFDELWDGAPIRLLGITANRLVDGGEARQLELFGDTDFEKLERLDRAMDGIRSRFGMDAVKRASFLAERRIESMPGRDLKK